ncbi:hypothetical protein ABIB82_007140 [Bradyrhizobium sp. i1.8.4]|uniref:hypothetical protein n=1 Tax=unclassified Bradyrhizobium TaxID=2631580 RepID=UPI003D1B6EDA
MDRPVPEAPPNPASQTRRLDDLGRRKPARFAADVFGAVQALISLAFARSHEAVRWNLFVVGMTTHERIGYGKKISDGCLRVLLSPQFSPRMVHPVDRSAGLSISLALRVEVPQVAVIHLLKTCQIPATTRG